eukprot:8076518-Alexandrium_andersonii.AAC.1
MRTNVNLDTATRRRHAAGTEQRKDRRRRAPSYAAAASRTPWQRPGDGRRGFAKSPRRQSGTLDRKGRDKAASQ